MEYPSLSENYGITILRKSDPSIKRKRRSKVALVLAGGAVSGGSYKIGSLKALNDYLMYRRTENGRRKKFGVNDFDIFVGLSAGAFIASILAARATPEDIYKTLCGKSTEYLPFRSWHFMRPNYTEIYERIPLFLKSLYKITKNWISGEINPYTDEAFTIKETLIKTLTILTKLLPSGILDIKGVEKYLLKNMKRMGLPNNFEEAYRLYKKELYLTAVDLNTGEKIVFGHDEKYKDVPITSAITASCGLPFWYRTVRIRNPLYGQPGERKYLDLADGGIVRTANVKVAIEKGADLVVCYNPFRPIHYPDIEKSLYDQGPYTLLNQILRIVLGTRLDVSKEKYLKDPDVKTDIIYIEPSEFDFEFFLINPLNFWSREISAEHGFDSVRKSIDHNFEPLREIFAYHGIEITRKYVDFEAERLKRIAHKDREIEEVMETKVKVS